jgi:ABC-type multidrug transport system ATPase subunit
LREKINISRETRLSEKLTVRETVDLFAQLSASRAGSKKFGSSARGESGRLGGKLRWRRGGWQWRQRWSVAAQVPFPDEPTTGLDPQSRRQR